jgi:hypothetical protein
VWNWLLGLPGRIARERSPSYRWKRWAYSWLFVFTCLAFSCLGEFGLSCTAHAFFPKRLSNHYQGLNRILSQIFMKFNAVPFLDPSWNHIRSDIRLQVKVRKNQHIHSAAWNVVHWLSRCASTTMYHCIALTRPLYRWLATLVLEVTNTASYSQSFVYRWNYSLCPWISETESVTNAFTAPIPGIAQHLSKARY